ncbi:MAG TPA: hypothetical protein VFO67_02185 [Gemmatimonadales bacterium]|nr:hypothetical protein [Gemmatimonadales bacterium]
MPFKSKAQRRKFAALLMSGDITPEQYERWNRETGRAQLPERVKRNRKNKKKKLSTRNTTRTSRAKRGRR